MQKSILIALTLGVSSSVFATSFAGFIGGPGDGYAHGDFLTPQLVSVASHFLGGGRDGYGSCIYQQVILPAQKRFTGGGYDGYASARFFSIVPPARLAQFSGGNYDGYASAKLISAWSQAKPPRFFGGNFDGYDRRAVFGIPNWVVGDTDGNGLPDWWELKYFGVLTGTPPNGDADHDGVSNLNEYLAGTNPTNADSFFHITKLNLGVPTRIFAACEPGLYYTLQRANNLATNWVSISNQIRIPSSTEGSLELDDATSSTSRFYRVIMEH